MPPSPGEAAGVTDGAARRVPSPDPSPDRARQQSDGGDETLALRMATLCMNRGNHHQALQIVRRVLVQAPGNPDALAAKGRCLEAAQALPEAYSCYASALATDPSHKESLLRCATMYRTRGLLDDALAALNRIPGAECSTDVAAARAAVLSDTGTKLKGEGRTHEAIERYREAIQADPAYAPARYNLGVLFGECGRPEDAAAEYERAIDIAPAYPEALCNLGVIHRSAGRLQEAIKLHERAHRASPGDAVVRHNLASTLTDAAAQETADGRHDEAVALLERALALDPVHAAALYNMGVACAHRRQNARAIFFYETCVRQHPTAMAEAWNNLGVLCRTEGNMTRAEECFRRAVTLKPNFTQALNNLGVIFTARGEAQEGLQMLQAAIAADPTYAEAHNNLGVLMRDIGAIDEAIAAYSRCSELDPTNRNAAQNRLLCLNYIRDGKDPYVSSQHLAWGARMETLAEKLEPLPNASTWDCAPERPLVIGYVSPDLYTHSVSYFAEVPITRACGADFEVRVYNCTPTPDAKTRLLRERVEAAGNAWVDCAALDERQLAERIRADRVDVLVELTGHTANNRLGTMAMQPCPVGVTWIGYPNTTGLASVHYRITDAVADPETTPQVFSEELVRLPGCFLCYTAPDDAPAVGPAPATANGFVTFGSFNNLAKITPEVVRVWARILHAVPGSRLLLKNKPFACDVARGHVMGVLEAEGIDASRVDMLPLAPGTRDHLSTYNSMDISLDPFPYAGTTTTCESLLMGVPVLTLRGACHAQNVSVSLLTAVGIADGWVAGSTDEYVHLAAQWASDLSGLAELRGSLRDRLLRSPLCDAGPFMDGVEAEYRRMWKRWCRGQVEASAAAAAIANAAVEVPAADGSGQRIGSAKRSKRAGADLKEGGSPRGDVGLPGGSQHSPRWRPPPVLTGNGRASRAGERESPAGRDDSPEPTQSSTMVESPSHKRARPGAVASGGDAAENTADEVQSTSKIKAANGSG